MSEKVPETTDTQSGGILGGVSDRALIIGGSAGLVVALLIVGVGLLLAIRQRNALPNPESDEFVEEAALVEEGLPVAPPPPGVEPEPLEDEPSVLQDDNPPPPDLIEEEPEEEEFPPGIEGYGDPPPGLENAEEPSILDEALDNPFEPDPFTEQAPTAGGLPIVAGAVSCVVLLAVGAGAFLVYRRMRQPSPG